MWGIYNKQNELQTKLTTYINCEEYMLLNYDIRAGNMDIIVPALIESHILAEYQLLAKQVFIDTCLALVKCKIDKKYDELGVCHTFYLNRILIILNHIKDNDYIWGCHELEHIVNYMRKGKYLQGRIIGSVKYILKVIEDEKEVGERVTR